MDQLSNFISEYLKTCETIKKLNSKTIKACLLSYALVYYYNYKIQLCLSNLCGTTHLLHHFY